MQAAPQISTALSATRWRYARDPRRAAASFNPCTVGSCDPILGVIQTPVADGTTCADADVCNGDETCNAGTCTPGTPLDPDDSNPCTADSCDPATGIENTPEPLGTSCADADACNGDEQCDGFGTCQLGTPGDFDDGDPSTIDICWDDVGIVHHQAPEIDGTVGTTVHNSMRFLFEGLAPAQRGVAPGIIHPVRIAVIRGLVMDTSGAPLPGVRISARAVDPNQPDFGYTLTDASGAFSFAVNGGGRITLDYTLDGHVPVQRATDTAWNSFRHMDDVVMTKRDTAVTAIDTSGTATSLQIHQATTTIDPAFANRTAVVLFNSGTTAELVFADGTTTPAPTLSLRATELTVGDLGPNAMPGELPPTSQYTYAINISADEAIAAGATSVQFDQPAWLYVENFYQVLPSTLLPNGYYDAVRGQWVAEPDGFIVNIVTETAGLADLDFDGDGIAEGTVTYDAMLVTDEERAALAQLYDPGASLWRSPLNHITEWDTNLNSAQGDEECKPGTPDCDPGEPQPGSDDEDDDCPAESSIIECNNQILGEAVPITGTPYALHYKSDRVDGRTAPRQLTVPITPDEGLPPFALNVFVDIEVAGRKFDFRYLCDDYPDSCLPGGDFTFEWDGLDHLGRTPQGPQQTIVRLGYSYRRIWSGGIVGIVGGSGGGIEFPGYGMGAQQTFGKWPDDTFLEVLAQSPPTGVLWAEFVVYKRSFTSLGAWTSLPFGLGGYSLSAHHGYSPGSKTLYYGDGRRRRVENEQNTVNAVAGKTGGATGDGIPATEASIAEPRSIAVGPDGSIYIASFRQIKRVDPDGIINTIANVANVSGYNGTEIPATSAQLTRPNYLELGADGTLYFSDSNRIRSITPDGILHTLAGNGTSGFSGDGGPAVQALIAAPHGMAVGADDTVYFWDGSNRRIRAIYTDGTIDTVAGGGTTDLTTLFFQREPKPSYAATALAMPGGDADLAVTSGGTLYWGANLTSGRYVLRIGPGADVAILAGRGSIGTSPDGEGSASLDPETEEPLQAALSGAEAITVGPDGDVYVILRSAVHGSSISIRGVRRIEPDGKIYTVVGGDVPCGQSSFCGDGGPARAARVGRADDIAFGPTGALYITSGGGTNRVIKVNAALPELGLGNYVIPSEDGTEVYIFDEQGRHLETRDAALGHAIYTFDYDVDGLLDTITDMDGRDTTLLRDPSGQLERIIGPFGHETEILTDSDGYIASIANPLDEAVTVTYHPDLVAGGSSGLIATFTDPRSHTTSYTFDADGRLTLAERPAPSGGTQTFTRTALPAGTPGTRVTRTTAEGRVTEYDIEDGENGEELWTVTQPNGIAANTFFGNDETDTTTRADGTTITLIPSPDSRFDMMAPIAASRIVETGGRTLSTTTTRDVVLTNELDPLSVETITDTVTINGRTFTTTLDTTSPAPTRTRVTPAGRTTITELDARGRPTRIEITGLVSGTTALAPTLMEYDDGSINPAHAGLLRAVTRGTGATERRFDFTYDADGNLQQVDAPLGQTTSFTYDAATRVTSQTFPDGEQVRFFYDAAGNLETLAQPGSPAAFAPGDVHQLTSEERNLLDEYVAPDVGLASHTTSHDYTADGDLDLTTRPDTLVIDRDHDAAGRLSRITTPNGTIDYFYFGAADPVAPGKLESIVDGRDGITLDFAYDGRLLTSTTWSGAIAGNIVLDYDDDLRVVNDTISGGALTAGAGVAYTYADADGLLTNAGDLTLVLDPDTALLTGANIGSLSDSIEYNEFAEPVRYAVNDGTS